MANDFFQFIRDFDSEGKSDYIVYDGFVMNKAGLINNGWLDEASLKSDQYYPIFIPGRHLAKYADNTLISNDDVKNVKSGLYVNSFYYELCFKDDVGTPEPGWHVRVTFDRTNDKMYSTPCFKIVDYRYKSGSKYSRSSSNSNDNSYSQTYSPHANDTAVMKDWILKYGSHSPVYFSADAHDKYGIILHWTAGTGAMLSGKYGAQFSVDRDGKIYSWAPAGRIVNHTERGCNTAGIGIEIANVGPVKKEGNNWIYGYWGTNAQKGIYKYGENTIYTITTTDDLKKSTGIPDISVGTYGGDMHFATFPAAQIEGIHHLIGQLLDLYPNIPNTFINSVTKISKLYYGISTHINYTNTQKVEMGPAYPYQKLRDMLKSYKRKVIA